MSPPRALTRAIQRLTGEFVHSGGRTRPLVVTLDPTKRGLIGFRLAGTRTTHYLRARDGYLLAVRATAQAARDERARLRKAKAK